jgi:NADH:ubiquinone oxidoreductase subunit E
MSDKINITVCLGSSCFSRKNRDVVSALQEYVHNRNLSNKVQLRGGHCFGDCKRGPIMIINEQEFTEITPQKAIAILESFLMDE